MAARNVYTPSMNAARSMQIDGDQRDVDPHFYMGLGLNGIKETRVEVAGSTWEPQDRNRLSLKKNYPPMDYPNSAISKTKTPKDISTNPILKTNQIFEAPVKNLNGMGFTKDLGLAFGQKMAPRTSASRAGKTTMAMLINESPEKMQRQLNNFKVEMSGGGQSEQTKIGANIWEEFSTNIDTDYMDSQFETS